MLSRRNFFTISVMMLIVLFMFQFSGTAKEKLNQYQYNNYEENTKTSYKSNSEFNNSYMKDENRCAFIGNVEDNSVGSVVRQWSIYRKRNLKLYNTLNDFNEDKDKRINILFLDSRFVDYDKDIDKIQSIVNSGVNLVFCNLPQFKDVVNNKKLCSLLGIKHGMLNDTPAKGINLFSGFILGGQQNFIVKEDSDKVKQDMNLNIPWYVTTSGTKVYMNAVPNERKYSKISHEEYPAIIWRNSIYKGDVFVVNGDYLSDNAGIGIINGMISEMNEYDIYPVINAQNTVIINYPDLTDENLSKMREVYSRSSSSVLRDIIWPGLASVKNRTGSPLTYIIAPKLDYDNDSCPEKETLQYYFKMINEQNGEIGLSMAQKSSIDQDKKMKYDKAFLQKNIPQYRFTALYDENTESNSIKLIKNYWNDIKTVLKSYDDHKDLVSYADDTTTAVQYTSNGIIDTFSEELKKNSIQTALGYSTVILDMRNIVYPVDTDDYWEMQYKKFSSNTIDFWKKYNMFDQTVLSETDKKLREFLTLDYEVEQYDNKISLSVKKFKGGADFILRTHGKKVKKVNGGSYKKIEDEAYLISADKDKLDIYFGENTGSKYYY